MKTTLKQEETAARTVQDLPGTGTTDLLSPSSGLAASQPAGPGPVSRLHLDRQGVLSLEISAWEWMHRNPLQEAAQVSEAAGLETTQSIGKEHSMLHKVEQLIAREVLVIRQLKADSLTVVLRPDPETEMVLQLNRKDGQVEAFVRCERKAFELFHRNWAQLQESMTQHHVQLLPLKQSPTPHYQHQPAQQSLEDAGNFADRSPQREESSQRHPRDPQPAQPWEPESPGPSHALRSSRARRASAAGWESWA